MAGKEKAPTFEEYRALVKKHLQELLKNVDNKEIEKFLDSEMAIGGKETVVREAYNNEKAKFDSGEVTYRQFTEGNVAGTAYGLYMMY